jgi:lysosomal alpha-glucosidase
VDQDPVALGTTVVRAAKQALQLRYSLLPFLYTLFYWARVEAQTVVRPMFFEFPKDSHSHTQVVNNHKCFIVTMGFYQQVGENQFLWGAAVLVCPVLKANQTNVSCYLPRGQWYHYTLALNDKPISYQAGHFEQLDAPIDKVNVLVRGGHVLPLLPPKVTTTLMRKENFTLLIALDDQSQASGDLFWDDGDSIDTIEEGVRSDQV